MTKKVPIALKIDAPLLERLDRFKDGLTYPTTRTALIEVAIQQMLDRAEKEGKRR